MRGGAGDRQLCPSEQLHQGGDVARIEVSPAELAGLPLERADDGHALVYTFDAQADGTGIAGLLRRLDELGIAPRDLHTHESSLEDIFVDLVHRDRSSA